MYILGIIPARYQSSRLPGKPIVDICGRPMIWWVYQQVRKVSRLDEICIATDDERICNICEQYQIPMIMTNSNHKSHINRLHEVSEKKAADLYVCVCGDEPLTQAKTIERIIPAPYDMEPFIARSLMRELDDPAETMDPSNLKLVTDKEGYALLVTRSVVPYPHKTTKFKYKKVVGIECYNKEALDFFASTNVGILENIEDTNLLRFIEQRKPLRFIMTDAYQLSVDTLGDLHKVREIIQKKLDNGELKIQ